jgi:hypothetical protein
MRQVVILAEGGPPIAQPSSGMTKSAWSPGTRCSLTYVDRTKAEPHARKDAGRADAQATHSRKAVIADFAWSVIMEVARSESENRLGLRGRRPGK